MGTERQWETLNYSLGYEVCILVLGNPMSKKEIRSILPYEYVREDKDDKVQEIVRRCFDEDILEIAGTRGPDKYYLDDKEFCEKELKEINRRAIARMYSPHDGRGPPLSKEEIPDKFFKMYERNDVHFGSHDTVHFIEELSSDHKSIYHYDEGTIPLKFEVIPENHADAENLESYYAGPGIKPWTWDD